MSLLSIQAGKSPLPLLKQNMYILAVITNVIAGFVQKHLLRCSGVLFRFIFVAMPCWACAVKGLGSGELVSVHRGEEFQLLL